MKTIADYEGAHYRTAFWEGRNREYEDRVERIAMKRLLPSKGGRLLELGAGFGRLTNLYTGFKQVVLVDYDLAHLAYARDRYGHDGYLYVAADIYHLPFAPGQFDAATMVRTLHHMGDPLAALQQSRMALRRDGAFILEYANKRNLRAIVRWLSRGRIGQSRWGTVSFNPFRHEVVEFDSNYYGFHPRSVLEMLSEAGFRPRRQLAVSYLRAPILKRLLPLGILVRLDALLQLTGGWWPLSPSEFLRTMATGDDLPSPLGAFWRCPACGGMRLQEESEAVRCHDCGHSWPIRNGIYDFRLPLAPERRVSAATAFGW